MKHLHIHFALPLLLLLFGMLIFSERHPFFFAISGASALLVRVISISGPICLFCLLFSYLLAYGDSTYSFVRFHFHSSATFASLSPTCGAGRLSLVLLFHLHFLFFSSDDTHIIISKSLLATSPELTFTFRHFLFLPCQFLLELSIFSIIEF